jgi:hypothetical protein
MEWFRRHLSFANVVSVIALFVALGGASYAAVTLPKNSVGPKQIKKRAVRGKHINKNAVSSSKIQSNAITGSKIADGAVGSSEVFDNSLTADDLADASVGSAELADGSVNSAKVADGSIGKDDLQPGAAGLPKITVQYEIAPAGMTVNTSQSFDVLCPAGQQAVGGGARGDTTDSEYTIVTSSRPLQTGGGFPTDNQTFNGWRATVLYRGAPTGFPASPPDGDIKPEVWAICASAAP